MSDLTGSTISTTYNLLLTTESAVMGSSLQSIQSGTGVSSALKLSETIVSVDGNLAVGTESANVHSNYSTITIDGDAAGGSMVDLECNATRIASFYTNSSTDARVITHTSAPLLLGANSTPSVYIADGGLVGIGGTPSAHPLEVHGTDSAIVLAGSSAADSYSQFRLNSGNQDWRITSYGESFSGDTDLQSTFSIFGGDSTGTLAHRLVIDSSGNVGIGTDSPSDYHDSGLPLVVGDGSDERGLTILSDSTNGSINFSDGSHTHIGRIYYDHSVDAMNFSTNAGTRMTIDSDGNVILANVQEGDSGLASGTIYKDSGFLKIVA